MSDGPIAITAQTSAPSSQQLLVLSDGKAVSLETLAAAVRDTIHIGGRNYLQSEPFATGNSKLVDGKVTFVSVADSYFYLKLASSVDSLVGKEVTLSFDCDGMNEASAWDFRLANKAAFSIPLRNGRCVYTFVFDKGLLTNDGRLLLDDGNRRLVDMQPSDVMLWNFQLEEGNMATAYRPAPEELASANWGGE